MVHFVQKNVQEMVFVIMENVNVILVFKVMIVQHQLNVLEWLKIQTVITQLSLVVSLFVCLFFFLFQKKLFFGSRRFLISLLLPPTTSSSFFLSFLLGGNGRCFRNRCYCAPGFLGNDCATPAPCEDGCSENGHCQDGALFLRNFFTAILAYRLVMFSLIDI